MRISSRRFESLLAFLAVAASAGLFLLLALPALSGKIYIYDDLGHSHLPMRQIYAQALALGHSFLWAPQYHCGFYLLGDGLVGMLHPLHLFLYKFLPLDRAFNLELLSSYPFLFVGMYWLTRRWGLPRPAALMGAMTFAFSGFTLLHYMHLNAVAIVAHFPWLIACADLALEAKSPKERAGAHAGLALLTGSQLLLGYPQYVLLSLVGEASYVLWKISQDKEKFRRGGWWLGAKFLGGLTGLAQILPTLETLSLSVRRDPSLNFSLSYSLHPMNLIQLWSPLSLRGHAFGAISHEFGLYNGSFGTLALAWPWVRRNNPAPWNLLARALAIFAACMILFALGRYGLIYYGFVRLPLFGLFRTPARYIVLVHWALSALAAFAFADLSRISGERQCLPWKSLWPLSIFPVLGVLTSALAIYALGQTSRSDSLFFLDPLTYSSVPRVCFGTGLLLAATGLTTLAARGYRWSLAFLVLLSAFDIFNWGLDYVRRQPPNPIPLFSQPPMTLEEYKRMLPTPPDNLPGRIAFSNSLPWGSALVLRGYSLVEGYVALEPAKEIDPQSRTFERLANARWILSRDRWDLVSDPMPRVRLVTELLPQAPTPGEEDRVDISRTAWTDVPVHLEPGKPGTARLLIDEPGRIDVGVAAHSTQLLVVSESFHPGWKAAVDGKPVPVLRAYGNFLACAIGPNMKRAEFRFRPAGFFWGIRWSLTGLCLTALTAAFLLTGKALKDS